MENAAQRLNHALRTLEGRIAGMKQQLQNHPEVELLDQENRQLHEELAAMRAENSRLQGIVEELGEQLDQAVDRVEQLMNQASVMEEETSYEHR